MDLGVWKLDHPWRVEDCDPKTIVPQSARVERFGPIASTDETNLPSLHAFPSMGDGFCCSVGQYFGRTRVLAYLDGVD